jgi:hypothetical protein
VVSSRSEDNVALARTARPAMKERCDDVGQNNTAFQESAVLERGQVRQPALSRSRQQRLLTF